MKTNHVIILVLALSMSFANAKDNILVYKTGRLVYKCDVNNIDSITFKYRSSIIQPFIQDSAFAKIYATLGQTGNQQPSGMPDITGIDESETAFIRQIWELNELSTDEAICAWSDPGIPDLNFNSWRSSNPAIEGLYLRLMFDINLCSQFLSQTAAKADDKSIKQQAEVRFMRALNYYYLLDMFGNAPFVTTVSYDLPVQINRSDLYAWIVNELLAAEPNMYEPRQAPYYRADKAAAWMLLARLYLNAEVYTRTSHYAEAATYAKKVIDSSYKLNPSYAQLFMGDNAGALDGSTNTAPQEIILPIACDGLNQRSWGNSLFLIASTHSSDMPDWGNSMSAWGGNRARATLVKKFFPGGIPNGADMTDLRTAAGDNRAMFYAVNRTIDIALVSNLNQGLSVTKFTNLRSDGKTPKSNMYTDTDVPLFRVAEAYLTYAEATLRSGGNSNEALTYINALRSRSNARLLTSLTYSVLIDEWSREFYFEGQRRTDLIRFGYFSGINYIWDWKGGASAGQSINDYNNVFQIPTNEINANPNLMQNVGY